MSKQMKANILTVNVLKFQNSKLVQLNTLQVQTFLRRRQRLNSKIGLMGSKTKEMLKVTQTMMKLQVKPLETWTKGAESECFGGF